MEVVVAVLAFLVLISKCSCAVSTCFLVILHVTIRMMTTTIHTNISSTSVDGITALRMIMVDIGRPVCPSVDCCCVGVAETVAEVGWLFTGRLVWLSVGCSCVGRRKIAVCYWMSGR